MSAELVDILLQYLKAFIVGGGICLIAQIIINYTDLTAGKILVYFMLAGVVLTAIGIYQPLVEFAGAGATVPISGFGYLLAQGAIKGAEKGFFFGDNRQSCCGKCRSDGSCCICFYNVDSL